MFWFNVVLLTVLTITIIPVDSFQTNWNNINSSYTNDIFGVGIYIDSSISHSIPGGRFGGCSWSINDRLYLFGGKGYAEKGIEGDLSDMWVYDSRSMRWRYIKGHKTVNEWFGNDEMDTSFDNMNYPGPRAYAICMIDKGGDSLLMHGGKNFDRMYMYTDIYEFDVINEEWRKEMNYPSWYYPTASDCSDQPSRRGPMALYQHTAAKIDNDHYLIFGGVYGNTMNALNILWEFTVENTGHNCYRRWRYLEGNQKSSGQYPWYYQYCDSSGWTRGVFHSSVCPSSRYDAVAYGLNGFYYLFGGGISIDVGRDDYLNDFFAYDYSQRNWAWLGGTRFDPLILNSPNNIVDDYYHKDNAPGARGAFPQWLGRYDDLFVMFGGRNHENYVEFNYYADIWLYSTKRNMWRVLQNESSLEKSSQTTEELLGGRFKSYILFRQNDRKTFLFSGKGPNKNEAVIPLRDVWEYTKVHADCSGHGTFNYTTSNKWTYQAGTESCVCDDILKYSGDDCEIWNCFTITNSDLEVCSNHGKCVDYNDCLCDLHYSTHNCSEWKCNGTSKTLEESVCSGHGICVGHDQCLCVSNYTGKFCDDWECDNISKFDESVCTSHGSCMLPENCSCESGFGGEFCQIWSCHSIENDELNICSGYGFCVSHDKCLCSDYHDGDNCSACLEGYYGNDCKRWFCYEIEKSLIDVVCSGHGICVSPNNCSCEDNYHNENCSEWSCFDYDKNDDKVCNKKKGECKGYNDCKCKVANFYGINCVEKIEGGIFYADKGKIMINYSIPLEEIQDLGETFECTKIVVNDLFQLGESPECLWEYTFHSAVQLIINVDKNKVTELNQLIIDTKTKRNEFVTVKLTIVHSTFADLFHDLIENYGVLLLVIVIIVSVIILFVIVLVGIITYRNVKLCLKNKKFSSLKNPEIILQEQKASNDNSIANLQINKALFEISFDEIEILEQIGKGGSGSTVYRSKWKNQIVAFKVFRIDDLSSQDEFDIFEREVSIISSIRSKYVLTFFGASIKPPRVGIITDFCELGDLKHFISSRKRKFLPFGVKLLLLLSISEGMSFLHERDIIHRDLKTSNVLLTEGEKSKSKIKESKIKFELLQAKIIDFGLSKHFISKSKSSKSGQMTKRVGTSYYMAPEVVTSKSYTFPVDVFSFAIIAFEVLTENFHPYGDNINFSVELKVANDPTFRPNIKNNHKIPKWLEALIKRCWVCSPDKRPKFQEISGILKQLSKEYVKKYEKKED